MKINVLEVSQLNTYIKRLLDGDELLAGLFVRGEISNYKMYPSGHHYFTLKDAESQIRCVMFKRDASRLKFRPENGMKIIAFGRVAVFPRDGQYQLYCSALQADGVGDLHVAFEQLKEKLYGEGLFDQKYKKPIPKYPGRIAVITSSAGAAVRDIIRILGRRYPLAKVIVLPVRVQGAEAPPEICAAIAYANKYKVADVIITGRGGGSIEDLWAFNDERVARAVFASEIPVISAVGHEPDVTISDFVADLRASTPSNAAELAVPDMAELKAGLASARSALCRMMEQKLENLKKKLGELASKREFRDPLAYIEDKRLLLDYMQRRMAAAGSEICRKDRERFAAAAAALDAMSPLKVLGRGYAIVTNDAGKVICRSSDAAKGDAVHVTLGRGRLLCRVEGEENEGKEAEF